MAKRLQRAFKVMVKPHALQHLGHGKGFASRWIIRRDIGCKHSAHHLTCSSLGTPFLLAPRNEHLQCELSSKQIPCSQHSFQELSRGVYLLLWSVINVLVFIYQQI